VYTFPQQVLEVINPVIWQELDGLAIPRTASYWQQDDGQSGVYSGGKKKTKQNKETNGIHFTDKCK
jgi:hypothetical protein